MLFAPKEKGQGLVEYALILVLVAIVVISALTILGPAIGEYGYRILQFVKHYWMYGCGGFILMVLAVICGNFIWFNILNKDSY